MRSRVYMWLLLVSLLVPIGGHAEVQFHDFRAWTRARVIPVGQQIWGFQTSYQNSADQFSSGGEVKPLGQGFRRQISWNQLLAATSGQDRRDLEGLMVRQGARESDVVATANYGVVREDVGFKVDWAYGLMRRWMVGFDVPVIHRKTTVDARIETVRSLPSFRSQRDVNEKLREVTARELSNSGYDLVPEESTEWIWGDVTLLSQVSLMKSYNWQTALRQIIRLPTSRNPSLDEYIQTSDDSGQIDLGLSALADYRLRRMTVGFEGGYVAQLPDSLRARVSGSQNVREIDPKVQRDLGDYTFGSVNLDYKFRRRTGILFEYSYLYKMADRYSGRSSDGFEYSTLGKNTEQDIHQTKVGLRYDLLSEGRRGGITDAWTATVAYNYPMAGHNVTRAGRATFDILRYF